MKASLQLNLTTQLALTPQLQQAIKLLQLSTLDLRQEIQQKIETNPLLEAAPEDLEQNITTQDATENEDEFEDIQWSTLYQTPNSSSTFNQNDFIFDNMHCTKENLHSHLIEQISLVHLNKIDESIAAAIIDAIDDYGFLTLPISEIHESLSTNREPITYDEVQAVLHRIQRLDPIGCAAKDLTETLLIQLEESPADNHLKTQVKKIIQHDIHLLAKHDYRSLMKRHQINQVTLSKVIDTILHLTPQPGLLVSNIQPEYIIPDLVVKKEKGQWIIEHNPLALPKVGINTKYASLINQNSNGSDNQFLKSNLQEAKWFLKSLQSRHETLMQVARHIVNYQKDFFEHGEEAMKPLILDKVANALDMHESTISRITTKKYLHTPRGVFELKFFFSSHLATTYGSECSSTAIRALIKKLVTKENPLKPLSDSKLVSLIKKQGIEVARRTIAKYREDLGIPPSFQRKAI